MRLAWFLLPCLGAVLDAQGHGHKPAPLFGDPVPVTLRLDADFHALFRDRGTQKTDHPAQLWYAGPAGSGTFAVRLRTRGIFRLKHCSFPPIRLDVTGNEVHGTLFAGQKKLKLVTHCQANPSYERNLLREYALYRVFNALTDTSFRVRLAHVTYRDSLRPDTVRRYGFLIESDGALARRAGAEVLTQGQILDVQTDPSYMTLVAVFQYLIGNTDWSVWGRHNTVILDDTVHHSKVIAVPYDYDFSGAVDAAYATPPPQLPIHSVRERLYRGYCQPDSVLQPVLARFRQAKDSMYAAVRAVPDLPVDDARRMLSYFDDFYHAIDDRGVVQTVFLRGCLRMPQ